MPTKSDIEGELRRIGDLLGFPCEWTHFGGCSMALQGIKDSTRDVDIVLHRPESFGHLVKDLDADYAWVSENEAKSAHEAPQFRGVLTDWEVLRGPLSIDLFPPGRIFNVLEYSPAMLGRRTAHIRAGNLQTYLADPTVTFMLKAITGRWRKEPGRDLEDLESILDRRGVDWAFIEAEWQRQLPACPDADGARSRAAEAMQHLRGAGYTVKWQP